MLAGLFAMMSQVLTLEAGQAFVVVAHLDCRAEEKLDRHRAEAPGEAPFRTKRFELLFTRQWPEENHTDVGILVLSAGDGPPFLSELDYDGTYAPVWSDRPQPPIPFRSGIAAYYSLGHRKGASWTYSESRAPLHGPVVRYQGACTLRRPAA